eukprot:TRINITY_DN23028_c0_g1_i1.p1 TRINITY_DN23028_c0_g1~~TRINITY_DN23028_c0_g1_i1.p1  ORF type:complete len:172 (-),score=7.83 TRINITY_DN23028_c0_g1_i1:273-788(-)
MNITMCFSTDENSDSKLLLEKFGFPFKKEASPKKKKKSTTRGGAKKRKQCRVAVGRVSRYTLGILALIESRETWLRKARLPRANASPSLVRVLNAAASCAVAHVRCIVNFKFAASVFVSFACKVRCQVLERRVGNNSFLRSLFGVLMPGARCSLSTDRVILLFNDLSGLSP